MEMDVYDSYQVDALKNDRQKVLTEFKTHLSTLLKAIGDPRYRNARQFTCNIVPNVPQQDSTLGDCGVWVCKFMTELVKGRRLCISEDPKREAYKSRLIMLETFYNRVIT